MKQHPFKRLGYVSVEVIITASIIFSAGFSGVILLAGDGTAQMAAKITKLDVILSTAGIIPTGEKQPIVPEEGSNVLVLDNDTSPVVPENDNTTPADDNTNPVVEDVVTPIAPTVYTVSTLEDGLTLSNIGWLTGSYSNENDYVYIPETINGKVVKEIQQDTFRDKQLISAVFDVNSKVFRIHARAFRGNNLTTIAFPSTLNRIDYWAFRDNDLTEIVLPESMTTIEGEAFIGNDIVKITIGSKLATIGSKAFGTNHAGFVEAYTANGAGTYTFVNNTWTKQ